MKREVEVLRPPFVSFKIMNESFKKSVDPDDDTFSVRKRRLKDTRSVVAPSLLNGVNTLFDCPKCLVESICDKFTKALRERVAREACELPDS